MCVSSSPRGWGSPLHHPQHPPGRLLPESVPTLDGLGEVVQAGCQTSQQSAPPPPQIPLVDGVWLTNQGGARLGGLHPSAPPSSPRKGGFRVGHRFCSCVAWAMLVLCREARLGGTVPVPGRSQGIAQGASVNHPRRVPGRAPAHGGGLALPGAGGVGRPAEGPTGVGPHPWGRRASQGDPHLGGVPTRCGVTCPTPQVTLWLGAAGDADAATGQAGWLPKTAVSSGRGQPALFGGSV